MKVIIMKFIRYFVSKWLSTLALEKIVILCLEELVKKTNNKTDDKIFEAIFKAGGKGDEINT